MMKRISRMETKKSYSWWWDSHISAKNSKWLEDNLEEMDRRVKEMLKLIEQEGDSFAKKAEMYYQKRPELTAHVENFYRMYRALAERYDNVTGELRKNMPSELESQSSSGSDFAACTPEIAPERRPPHRRSGPRAAGFDFFLGSGGSSVRSRRRSYSSSSSSESDSNSDNSKYTNGDEVSSTLHQRILALENELLEVKGKLSEYEGKDTIGRCDHLQNGDHVDRTSSVSALEIDLMVVDEKLECSLSEKNSCSETAQYVPSLEMKQIPDLKELISIMEVEKSQYMKEIDNLKVAQISADPSDDSDHDSSVGECKAGLSSLSKTYLQEKNGLETDVANLENSVDELKTVIKILLQEKFLLKSKLKEQELRIGELQSNAASSAEQILQYKSTLETRISDLSLSHVSLESKVTSLEDEIKQLESERMELSARNDKHTEELNKDLADLKLKVDMLASEKEAVHGMVSTLAIDIKDRDGHICQMKDHLHQLHLEHLKLITETDLARGASEELRSRVRELEDEVEKHRVAALDSAEGKREAIRQLCISLEHYRDGYYHLRQVLQGHNRTAVTAS